MVQRSAGSRWTGRLLAATSLTAALGAGATYAMADHLFRSMMEPGRGRRGASGGIDDDACDAIDNGGIAAASDRTDPHVAEERTEATRWFEEAKREVTIGAADHTRLTGWMLDPDRADPPRHLYAICCHDYLGGPADMALYAHRLARLGFHVLTPANRAHAPSGGRYAGMGLLENRDLLRWAEGLVARDRQAGILLFGVGMGASAVMMAVGERRLPGNVIAAVCQDGYHDAWRQCAHVIRRSRHIPWALRVPVLHTLDLITRRRAGYGLREADCGPSLRRVRIPMLFIQSGADRLVAPANLDGNFRDCASPTRRKLLVADAGHAMAAAVDPRRFWNTVGSFVAQSFRHTSGC
ncbi:alpha/beta hydrolase [Bifidobacterium sp. ESL0763]|uniref:alpha/beta hydrolase n=1 Tax=Bifidobacterium sp. ESL0763 TaxID=2983227 RepID=UPI0023FA07CD|nr:alpha/beta hydrolase [Bifidobacterium sp. ESL0763]MDF7663888.1 alpha/beta hydrolase [Bifidobacterium sp. ESL0763]